MYELDLYDEFETKKIGYKLGQLAFEGCIICLIGDLGAGKTTLTKSIAQALEINENITSPTFNIVNEYEGRLKLYHFDVYRIGSSEEMYDIGYDEYINSQGVCIIEWANLIEDILPDEYLNIEMKYTLNGRKMLITPKGEKYEQICNELRIL
ncbi:MAG: tRNA (adenosine(37)-N6)-threonylcarbamoyltransferase complex ATPase subunit type 1 TsaE [Clostridioides sp.]|jgi:tRNA threonylcarbamoyladenosine biosynthesis protein TsaE|nr:tRNA (adenosine(37)-N6)-threonylcarbamoyltransferase complex ATPase subunit type 1 TsaE [Clostridioides sp.]